MNDITLKIIGKIYTDFPSKFGVPRQSGLSEDLIGKIVMEPEFRNMDAFKGIEEFSYLWLIWGFSESKPQEKFIPMVRPPRLGGNVKKGVFATRSPNRPNPLAMSSVKLIKIENDEKLGPVLYVSGVDMMSGSPVYDIKPYAPVSDCHADADEGFTAKTKTHSVNVEFSADFPSDMNERQKNALKTVLEHDPKPSYQADPDRIYGMPFGNWDVKFKYSFTESETILCVIAFDELN